MADPYSPRRHRTPLPQDDESGRIREVAKIIAEQVGKSLESRDDDPTRRMPAMTVATPPQTPSGEFQVTVLTQLAALSAKMSMVDEIRSDTNMLREKQQEVLVSLARGEGRMNGLDQSVGTVNVRIDEVNQRLDRIERGNSSSLYKAVEKSKPQTEEKTRKPSWISGAKALAIVIVAVGTAIAAVVTVIVKASPSQAPVAHQEPSK